MAVITLLVAGCGGPSQEERFAQDACSANLRHARELLEIYDDVQHTRAAPGPEARNKQLRFILAGSEVTRTLAVDLKAIDVPDTEDAKEAATYFDNFARFAYQRMAAEERRVRELPKSITLVQSSHSLDQLEFALIDAFGIVKGGPSTITTQIPALGKPFENADSCQKLAALGTN